MLIRATIAYLGEVRQMRFERLLHPAGFLKKMLVDLPLPVWKPRTGMVENPNGSRRGAESGSRARALNGAPTGGWLRVRLFAVLGLILALLLAAGAALGDRPVQAQTTPQTTTTTLVSNLDDYNRIKPWNCPLVSGVIAQSFTTGPGTDGYPIKEVRLWLMDGGTRSASVKIREDDNGVPGDLVVTLTNPESFRFFILHTFTAPDDTTLEPSTTYWLTVNEGITGRNNAITVRSMTSDAETGETGWSIGNGHLKQSQDAQDWSNEVYTNSLVMEIKSTEGTVTASSNSCLGTLRITGSPITVSHIRLSPSFNPSVTEYTGTAPNWVDRLAVYAVGCHFRASTAFSTGQLQYLESYAGIDIGYGSNEFMVTVTAEDGTQTVYTFTVDRSADPPEPTDCPADTAWCAAIINTPDTTYISGYVQHGLDGNISSQEFNHGGRNYTVLRLSHFIGNSDYGIAPGLTLRADPTLPLDTVLQVADRTFTLSENSRTRSPYEHKWYLVSSPFEVAEGEYVTVSLKLPDSDNAKLSALTLTDADDKPIVLTPEEFVPNHAEYTATVANTVESVTLTATAQDDNATVAITDDDDTSTPDQATLDLSVGSGNVLTVLVTSQSGDVTKTYTVNVISAATQQVQAAGPGISGIPQVGQTLTADTSGIVDDDGLSSPGFTYQWSRQDPASQVVTDITGATGSSYVLTADDYDSAISVSVSFTDDGGNAETLTSYWVPVLPSPNSPATGAPTISGAAHVGETLLVDTNGIADTDGLSNATYGYQWLADDADIAGATATTYTLVDADAGATIKVRVSFTDDAGNDESLTSAATEPVSYAMQQQTANSPATGAPSISGAAQVGETLTASTTGISDEDGLGSAVYQYQWLADDAHIAGATAGTYTLADADAGAAIKVRVSFTDDGGNEESLTSRATAMVESGQVPDSQTTADSAPEAPNRPQGTAVFIGGVDLEWDDVPGAESYEVQQYRGGQWDDLPGDGVEIAFYGAGAIISGLDPQSSLWFQVRASNAHGISDWSPMLFMNATSEFTLGRRARPANLTATGAPVIRGMAQVGETLWVDTTGIEDGNGLDRVRFEYQWTSDVGSGDVDIAGATHLTYAWSETEEGRTVSVRVSFVDRLGYAESVSSEAVGTVATTTAANTPANGAPSITGTAQVGETLTADTSGISDDDGLTSVAYRYQWLADDADIAGATATAYTLVDTDEGAVIKVRVSFTDDAGNQETLTSAATDAVSFAVQQQTANSPATGAPTISGVAQVGETLLVDTSGIADADGLTNASYSYQWLSDDGSTVTEIANATGPSFAVSADDEGSTIQVKVSFTDDAGHDESLTSAATDAVEARPNSLATGQPSIFGTAQVGETLTADTSGISDADGLTNVAYRYQWLADDADIAGATATAYTLVDGDEGVVVKVRVSFTDDAGNEETLTSGATVSVAAAEPADPPAAPTGLTTAPSHDQVVLSWDDPQDASITGYVILRRNRATTEPGEFTELVSDTGSAVTTYTDHSVSAETLYTYRIRAINGHGVSELSRWARADTPAPPVPAKPTGLTGAASHDRVVLGWDDPQDASITGYVILRRNRATTAPGEFTELVADTGSAATTYTDDSVAADTLYTYRIKAINGHGVSELSRWFRADTPETPQ